MGYADYHMHTGTTIDGKMNEVQACEQAIAVGVTEIAFTNHSMLTEPNYNISVTDMIEHWKRIQDCQRRYPGLTIRLGLELDYYPDRDDDIAGVIRRYEEAIGRSFDLVLCAVHHMNGVFFSSKSNARELYDGADTVRLYQDYFALAARATQSGLYDVMAHPDLIKKYTNEFSPAVPFSAYREAVEPFVEALLTCRVGVELNTKGLVLPVAEIYPSDDFLHLYIQQAKLRDIDPIITFGSDAHKVKDVGARLSEAEQALRRAGHSMTSLFDHHTRIPIALGDKDGA